MGVSIHKGADGATYILPDERFDFSCYSEIHGALEDAKDVIFDLRNATYMDSSALGMLHLAREKSITRGRAVRIINAGGQPAQVLKMANFQKLFDIQWR